MLGEADVLDLAEQLEYDEHLCVELVEEIAGHSAGHRARVLLDLHAAVETRHGEEDVLGVQVGVLLGAVGALEVGARARLVLLALDLYAYLVQLVLDDVHHHLVVDVEVAVLAQLAVGARHHDRLLVRELLLLQIDQVLVHDLQVETQQLGHVVLLDALVEHEQLHAHVELEAVEGAHHDADETRQVARHCRAHLVIVARRCR